MAASATDSTSQTKPERLIFKLCGSIERLVVNEPRGWLSTFSAEHEREDRIARRLALCPQTHALRFHLEGEDCDETRPFDDLDEAFKLGDFLDRVIYLHPAQRGAPVSGGNGQLEAIVVDSSEEQAVDRSKQDSKATTKRGRDRQDERPGTTATSSKPIEAGPSPAAESHVAVDSYVPSYSQDRTLAGSQKSVKHRPTQAGGSKTPKTDDSGKPLQGPTLSLKKSHKSENQRRQASLKNTQDTLKAVGEARDASRKQPREDSDGDKLKDETTLVQKTPISEGKKSGKERPKLSSDVKSKKPMGESGLGGAATQPTTAPNSKKRKQEKGTSDSDYVYDGESGGQSPKKKSKIDKQSAKSKVGKKAR